MLVEPYSKEKIKIRLSNTESVNQNIYGYASLTNERETKSTSSTSNYFLTTNAELAKKLILILNDESKTYILDVNKTKECSINEMDLIKKYNLEKFFKGTLIPFYNSLSKLGEMQQTEITLGEGIVRQDRGGKFNIYFDNSNTNVELFRNSIIGVMCDIIIEVHDDYYLVYTEIKEELNIINEKPNQLNSLETISNEQKVDEDNNHIQKIIELSKQLELECNEEIIKEIIIECYKHLNC